MSADDPLRISQSRLTEKVSLIAIEKALVPWALTRLDQRNDFWRDGFVQIYDAVDNVAIATPLSFSLQAKGQERLFRCFRHQVLLATI